MAAAGTLAPLLPKELDEATRRLLAKASERELTLATAESCTGGMLASQLTDEAALCRSRASIAVSVTGFADEGEEPGLVHFGCARAGSTTVHRGEQFGPIGRGGTRIASLRVAIEMLTDML